jgi:predicted nucleic acid-binding protein
MNDLVCLDASYLLALFDGRDVWHHEAARIQGALSEGEARTVTPDCAVNEALTASARRYRERRNTKAFVTLAGRVTEAIPADAITWVSAHLPRWFSRCVDTMRGAAGALSFHDALLCVAAEELGYRTIISFDADFDRWGGLQRLGTLDAVKAWLRRG